MLLPHIMMGKSLPYSRYFQGAMRFGEGDDRAERVESTERLSRPGIRFGKAAPDLDATSIRLSERLQASRARVLPQFNAPEERSFSQIIKNSSRILDKKKIQDGVKKIRQLAEPETF